MLKLVVSEPQTKATRNGVVDLNENVVANTVDIFFYDEETFEIKKEVLNAIVSGTLIQLPTNPNEMETVFGTMGSGATCGIFVVANFTGTYQGSAGTRTITQVKNSLLPAPNWLSLPQASFVMTGYVQATLRNAQGATPIYETVNLERVSIAEFPPQSNRRKVNPVIRGHPRLRVCQCIWSTLCASRPLAQSPL